MFYFVFPSPVVSCRVVSCHVLVSLVLLFPSCPGPSTQQYLKIHIRPPAIGSVAMVNGDSHILSLPLTSLPPPPSLISSHQPLFTSFGYNTPTCSSFAFEPPSSRSEGPKREPGTNTHECTHIHIQYGLVT